MLMPLPDRSDIFADHDFGGFDDGNDVIAFFESQALGGGAGDG